MFATGLLLNASAMFAMSVFTTTRGHTAVYDKSATRLYVGNDMPTGGLTNPHIAMNRDEMGFAAMGRVERVVAHGPNRCAADNVHCLLRVRSAFGGFGLYYATALRGSAARYSAGVRAGVPEHVSFNLALHAEVGERRPMYQDPHFQPSFAWADQRFWMLAKNKVVKDVLRLGHRTTVALEDWLEDGEREACLTGDSDLRSLQICRMARHSNRMATHQHKQGRSCARVALRDELVRLGHKSPALPMDPYSRAHSGRGCVRSS